MRKHFFLIITTFINLWCCASFVETKTQNVYSIEEQLKQCKAAAINTLHELKTQTDAGFGTKDYAALYAASKSLTTYAHALHQVVEQLVVNTGNFQGTVEQLNLAITHNCRALLIGNQVNAAANTQNTCGGFCENPLISQLFIPCAVLTHNLPIIAIPQNAACLWINQIQQNSLCYVISMLDATLQRLALSRGSGLNNHFTAMLRYDESADSKQEAHLKGPGKIEYDYDFVTPVVRPIMIFEQAAGIVLSDAFCLAAIASSMTISAPVSLLAVPFLLATTTVLFNEQPKGLRRYSKSRKKGLLDRFYNA